jgi:Ca2+-binding RTX toxin-like protein
VTAPQAPGVALNGTSGDDVIEGGSGGDWLFGAAGNDTLSGEAGDDLLDGGSGSDVYHFSRGGGRDLIDQYDAGAGTTDAIQFDTDVSPSDVIATSDGASLTLSIEGTADSISVKNYFYGNDQSNPYKVEEIRFADSTVWGVADVWSVSSMRVGDSADNTIGGVPVLQGLGGNDTVVGSSTNALLDGGAGNDLLTGDDQNDLLAGGAGNDTLNAGAGQNVVSFSRGDGMDALYSDPAGQNSLSLGGGIGYNDLALSKDGNDLVVSLGNSESIALKDWYAGSEHQTMQRLQLILDATSAFDAGSGDPLLNRRVQTFDFAGLVSEFDSARTANPGLTSWQMTNALLAFHLSRSDEAALGGDLAYYYGLNGSFGGIGIDSAQQVIGASGFGQDAQTLRPFTGLQEGVARLA